MEPVGCHELEYSLSLVNYALLLVTLRSTVDPARTLKSFALGGMIHRLVKTYVCCTLQKSLCL